MNLFYLKVRTKKIKKRILHYSIFIKLVVIYYFITTAVIIPYYHFIFTHCYHFLFENFITIATLSQVFSKCAICHKTCLLKKFKTISHEQILCNLIIELVHIIIHTCIIRYIMQIINFYLYILKFLIIL